MLIKNSNSNICGSCGKGLIFMYLFLKGIVWRRTVRAMSWKQVLLMKTEYAEQRPVQNQPPHHHPQPRQPQPPHPQPRHPQPAPPHSPHPQPQSQQPLSQHRHLHYPRLKRMTSPNCQVGLQQLLFCSISPTACIFDVGEATFSNAFELCFFYNKNVAWGFIMCVYRCRSLIKWPIVN